MKIEILTWEDEDDGLVLMYGDEEARWLTNLEDDEDDI